MSYPDRKDEVNSSQEHRVEVELCSMRVEWKQQSDCSIRRMIGRKVDHGFCKTRTRSSGILSGRVPSGIVIGRQKSLASYILSPSRPVARHCTAVRGVVSKVKWL